jgi:hypothetical protein
MRLRLSSLGRRAAGEEGSVLVMAAGALMMLLLLGAIGIDAGWWFSHKRELQNEADAGALAAGVEYDQNWRACLNGDTTVAQNIANKARQYAADPTYTGVTLRNTQITDQGGNLLVNINRTGFDSGSSNDYPSGTPGMGSCYLHPADSVSPNGGVWTDVKVKESSAPVEFNLAGIASPDITAQARVQLNPVLSESKMSPLGLPVPRLAAVQMRLYSICGNTATLIGTPYDLQPLGSSHQTVPDITLWGRPNASGDNQAVTVTLPNGATCAADYARIGTELRVTGRNGVDVNSITCPSTSQQYAACWSDNGSRWGPEARVWGKSGGTLPTFKDAHVTSSACSPGPYFTRVASCRTDIALDVQWPATCIDTNLSNFHVSVTANGTTVALTPPATPSGTWTSSGGAFTTGVGGADDYKVSWNTSNCGQSTGSTAAFVQSDFVATDTNSGVAELVRLTNTPNVDPTQGAVVDFDSVQSVGATNTVSVYLTAGFQTSFSVGPLLKLRLDSSQQNGSINCNNGNQGIKDTYDSFVLGCSKYYGVNNLQVGTWWDGTQCPSPNTFPTNTQTNPWRCAPAAPGLSGTQIADGMAMRVGACTYVAGSYTGGCKTQLGCVPNNWVSGQTPSQSDPRLITVFLVPYGSFNGLTGGGSGSAVPVLDFGSFYVTSWAGQASSHDQDLCPGAITQNGSGEIDGHFVDLVDVNDNPDPTMNCDPSQLRPCLATLVR